MTETIGVRLRTIRDRLGMSQRALAEKAETSPSMVQRWEHDEVAPRWKSLVRLANALGVSPGWIKFGAGSPEPTWKEATGHTSFRDAAARMDDQEGEPPHALPARFAFDTQDLRRLGPAHQVLQNVLLDAAERPLTEGEATQLTLAIQEALRRLGK